MLRYVVKNIKLCTTKVTRYRLCVFEIDFTQFTVVFDRYLIYRGKDIV